MSATVATMIEAPKRKARMGIKTSVYLDEAALVQLKHFQAIAAQHLGVTPSESTLMRLAVATLGRTLDKVVRGMRSSSKAEKVQDDLAVIEYEIKVHQSGQRVANKVLPEDAGVKTWDEIQRRPMRKVLV